MATKLKVAESDDPRELQRTKILNSILREVIADKYRLVSNDGVAAKRLVPLGRGGSGVAFLANQMLHPDVTIRRAIKFFVYRGDVAQFTAHRTSGPLSTRDFREEIVNLAGFTHENILKVIEGGFVSSPLVEELVPFLVTEYIDGPTLKDALKTDDFVDELSRDPGKAINLILQLCRGVTHLHARNFYHCDIAPKNIFLHREETDWRVVVGDLGVGRTLRTGPPPSDETVFLVGTKEYAPPDVKPLINTEILLSRFRSLQPHWDIFAVVSSALEIVTACRHRGARLPVWLEALARALQRGAGSASFGTAAELQERVRLLDPVQHTIWEVGELLENSPGTHRLLVPVEPVATSPRIREIIYHPAFARLKLVPQLVMAKRIFHSGSHDRYEHSLGVYQNMRRYMMALLNDDEFLESFDPGHIELSLVAGLLSSLSRFPFSSIIDELRAADPGMFTEFGRTHIFAEFIRRTTADVRESLASVIERLFPRCAKAELEALLGSSAVVSAPAPLRLVSFLLSSSIDVRVLDYLRRDALHLGLTPATGFFVDDLLKQVLVRRGRLLVHSRGLSVVEDIIATRYWLFQRVYWNQPNRAIISMIKYVLRVLHRSDADFSRRFRAMIFDGSEEKFLNMFMEAAMGAGLHSVEAVCDLLIRPIPRRYRELVQLNRADGDAEARVACEQYERSSLARRVELQELIDAKVVGAFHLDPKRPHILLDLPIEHGAMKLGEDINIEGYRGEVRALTKMSGITRGAQAGFREHIQRLRVFLHPTSVNELGDKLSACEDMVRDLLLSFLA